VALDALRDVIERECGTRSTRNRRAGRRRKGMETWRRRCRLLQMQLHWARQQRALVEKTLAAKEKNRDETCQALSVRYHGWSAWL